jgi:CubicO group peptidase (beta-lactamase class C family)
MAAAALHARLQSLVSSMSAQYNLSISVSVKLDEGDEAAAAAGSGGFSPKSKVPSGSAVKPFTAVALLQLSIAGVLDIDAPVAPIVDAWRTKQSLPPLSSVFNDSRIELVTTRQLIGMRSGIKDYDDADMFQKTLERNGADILPEEYIRSAGQQSFACAPGKCVRYSGNNFVLAGEVLAATLGAPSWEALDQMAALTPAGQPALELEDTIFMGRGPCSQHGVSHQYAFRSFGSPPQMAAPWSTQPATQRRTWPRKLWPPHPPLFDRPSAPSAPPSASPSAPPSCVSTAEPKPNHIFVGHAVGSFAAPGAEHCCAVVAKHPGVGAWTYTPAAAAGTPGNCTGFDAVWQMRPAPSGVVSGWSAVPFNESDVVDLLPYSCLNGWTMGNIATTPIDLTRFYHALLAHKTLLRHDALEAMLTFHSMAGGGWTPGVDAGYGLGMMYNPMRLVVPSGTCGPPVCNCSRWQCVANLSFIGHPGEDWGSGVWVGRLVELNASVAVASTSGHGGLNASLTQHQNAAMHGELIQSVVTAIVQLRDPAFGGRPEGIL